MKKIFMLLIAATMIIGFAGISMAEDECATCTAPGTINRACPFEQDKCESYAFDYEDAEFLGQNNYCDDPKTPRRVLFPACNCENFEQGDTIDIRLEILVNGETGDNGAYWAEDINSEGGNGNGIQVGTYTTQTAACKPEEEGRYQDGRGNDANFAGVYDYLYYDEDGVLQTDGRIGSGCFPDDPDDEGTMDERVVIIQPNPTCIDGANPPGTHGFEITDADDAENRAIWAINIPHMRFDMYKLQAGDVISVKISVAKADARGCVDLGGICADTGCACVFVVGTLGCCLEDLQLGGHLTYPYATPMNDANWWYGMVITNLSDEAGEAVVTVYETDGDTASVTVPVAARGMYVANNQSLMTAFGGTIGNSRAYFVVDADFTASGFMFIGNDAKGEAMGYLPVSRPIYDALLEMMGNLPGIPK